MILMNIVLLGPPGVGKGTVAAILSQKYAIPHISTGNMLREAVAKGTALGKQAKEFMDAGELVPDELVTAMVKERVAQPDCKKGFILDGYPRTSAQARALQESVFGKRRLADESAELIRQTREERVSQL